ESGRAILAQSAASQTANAGKVAISVASGVLVETGPEGAETIGIKDGNANTLTNAGTITQRNPDSFVIRTDGKGDLAVTNTGTINGSIRKGSGAGAIAFANDPGGRFATGREVNLGPSGRFVNASALSPHGFGSIGTSRFTTGLYQHTADAVTQIDFSFADNRADSIEIDSATIVHRGRIAPNPIAGLPRSNQTGNLGIIRSRTDNGDFSGLSVGSTAVIDYRLQHRLEAGWPASQASGSSRRTSIATDLDYAVDYTPWDGTPQAQSKVGAAARERITRNHTSFGGHIDRLVVARLAELEQGGGDLDFVNDFVWSLLKLPEVIDLVDIYGRFAPGGIFAPADAATFASRRFTNQLYDCPAQESERKDVPDTQDVCAWLRVGGITNRRQRDGLKSGYDEDVFSLSAGAEVRSGDWTLGGALGYEESSLSGTIVSGNGDRMQAGAALSKRFGETTLSGSLSVGHQDFDLRRVVRTPRDRRVSLGDPASTWVSGHLRVKHPVAVGEATVLEPFLDIGLTREWNPGYTETGAGPYSLIVDDSDERFATFNPGLLLNGAFEAFGMDVEATARAGFFGILGNLQRSATVRFAGVGPGGPSFIVRDDSNRRFAELGLALQVAVADDVMIEASVDTLLSETQQEYAGGVQLIMLF
ncbi:MAG: autotransporter outer membrane beta-barrel domain-containing protein, partial [Thiohalocapsa sp.]